MSNTQTIPNEQYKQLADDTIKILSAMGYLLWLIDDFESNHKAKYRQEVKNKGNLFREELIRCTNFLWNKNYGLDDAAVAEEQVLNYYLVERLHQVAMTADRELTTEQAHKLHFSLQNVLYTFGINVKLAIELKD